MFKNNLKIAFRQFAKHKTSAFINLSGLTIGLAAAMLISLYVLNERQTDRSLPHPERTFRLLRVSNINNEPYDIGVTSGPFAPALLQDFPADVAETVRVLDGNSLVTIGEQRFLEEKYYYADPNFFHFFNFPLLHGDPNTALAKPHSIVLSQATARRYFGSETAALGQTLHIDNDYDATVTGVFADPKAPTHLDFDLVESSLSFNDAEWWTTGWWNNSLCTYLRLSPGTSAAALEARLPKFMDKYFGNDFARNGSRIDLRLQALRDVYFESEVRYDPMRHGDRKAVSIFLIAALLLVVIACANYINLSTARSLERSKAVGVHKVLGSGRGRIIGQMLGESFLLTSAAVLLAVQLVWLALPWFSNVFGVSFQLDLPFGATICSIIGLTVVVALLAGIYPGWFLSAFKPATVLKGKTTAGERHTAGLRKTLVVFQFILSVGLLCSTFVVRRQLDFLKNKNLGFDKTHVLVLNINSQELYNNRAAFRQQLSREPGVRQISFLNGIPGGMHDATSVDVPEMSQNIRLRTVFADFDFVKTFGLKMVAGRDFDQRLASDSSRAALLNERAVADLGLRPEEALGKKILLTSFDTIPRTVVGVVKDYHFASLHDAIEPMVISTAFRGGIIAVKAEGARIPEVIASAEKAWNAQAPAYPFAYQFLDEQLDRLYQNEVRQGRIFGWFAGIAIFIACLGMFGLAAFAATSRIKEIGIRKVLGASVGGIVGLLSKDFLKLVAIAIVIASPLAYYVMQKWLSDFAYRIDIPWWVFVSAGAVAIGVAVLTVSFQSVKAALANPVESLRSD